MKRRVQIPILVCLLGLLVVGGLHGCCDDDDCGWYWRCYWIDGIYRCYWVWTCDGPESCPPPNGGYCPASNSALAMELAAFDAGGEKLDVRVVVTGDLLDPDTPVSVLPRGTRVPEVLRQSMRRVWWFSGLDATRVTGLEVQLVGTDVGRGAELPPAPFPPGSGCSAPMLLDPDLFPEIPATLPVGDELIFYSPASEEVLSAGENTGLFVALLTPGAAETQTFVLPEGEWESVALRQAGTWNVRVFLFSNDLCEPDSTNLILVQETDVLVQ